MTVGEIYLQIKQGLVQLGKYADGQIINSELNLALDVELINLVAEVLKSSATETTTFFSILLNDIKKEVSLSTEKEGNELKAILPDDCEVPLKISLKIEQSKLHTTHKLTIGNLYKPVEQAQINNNWYKFTDIIKATQEEFYGKVNEISYVTVATRLTGSDKIDMYRTSQFYKSTTLSPLSTLINKNISVFTSCAGEIILAYYKSPITFKTLKPDEQSPYSEIVNGELIKLVINNIKQR